MRPNASKTAFRMMVTLALLSAVWLTPALAQQNTDTLSKLEEQLFSQQYSSDSLENRLNRLENVIYGEAKTGDTQQRLSKLEQVYHDFKPEIPEQQAAQQNNPAKNGDQQASQPEERDATDYPAVTELENTLFKKSFATDNIQNRLVRLEKQVFNKTFEELPMVDRVDQLTLKVLPNNPLAKEENALSSIPDNPQNFTSSNAAIYADLAGLEEQLFGRSFDGALITDRLSRLEMRVFHQIQKGTVDQRLSKLQTNYRMAQQQQQQQQQRPSVGRVQPYTPNYPHAYPTPNNNGYSNNGYGNGGGYSNNYPNAYPTPQQQLPPQVQFGGGISQGGTYSYSSEVIDMLPPQLRNQIQGGGTVVGMPQYQTQPMYPQVPPNYYYGGQPAPYNYGAPRPQQQRRYNNSYNNSYNSPYYQSVPPLGPVIPPLNAVPNDFNQAMYQQGPPNAAAQVENTLAILEDKIFGQSFQGRQILPRLNMLETEIFGHSNAQYPVQQRLDLLMQNVAYQQSTNPQSTNPLDQQAQQTQQQPQTSTMGRVWNKMTNDPDNARFPVMGSSDPY